MFVIGFLQFYFGKTFKGWQCGAIYADWKAFRGGRL